MQRCRSLLFVPADSDRKIEKSATSGADIVIYDLEDAVLPEQRDAARHRVVSALSSPTLGDYQRCVRINPINTVEARADLEAIMPAAPALIMLPKIRSAADINILAIALKELESRCGLVDGSTRIIALMTETASMTLALPTLENIDPRVIAMTWGGEDLSAALGAMTNKDSDGHWTFTYQLARTQCLLAARSAGVMAIDTLFSDFRNSDGLTEHTYQARRDGFDGVLAIHPAQVEIINAGFIPSDAEIRHAQQVVDAFSQQPGAGAVQLDGVMLDRPHLTQAERILARAN